MAKRRRSNQRDGRDDYFGSLTGRLPRPEPLDLFLSQPRAPARLFSALEDLSDLRELEDRRLWSPVYTHPATGYSPARTFFGVPARVVAGRARSAPGGRSRPLGGVYPVVSVGFERPRSTLVCVRRARRREVLHALGVAGSRGLRRPRRNVYSAVSCKR